ncbi:MAG: hypothetical protein ACK4S4_15875 [Pyrinomonadaceae bacterium]
MRTVIGLTGYAGSGKDEAARALIGSRGFVKVGFADPLREAMSRLNPIVGRRVVSGTFFPPHDLDVRYREAVHKYGYDEAKKRFPEMRELLQRFGTEVGREMFGPTFWTDQAKRQIDLLPELCPVVITDVRFQNEVDVIRDYHGLMIRIERPGVTAVNSHASDTNTAKLPVDVVISNDGTIADLHARVLRAFEVRFVSPLTRDREYCDGYEQPGLFEEVAVDA